MTSIVAHSSDHAVTSDSKTGLRAVAARANASADHSSHIMLTASNYNDRVLALRYVYVLALSIWFGGTITIGAIASPVSEAVQRRFFLSLYVAGGLVLTTLFGMALLGPRPSGFFARFCRRRRHARTDPLRRPRSFEALSIDVLAPIAAGGLALLFWEARDGTRAA